MLHKFEWRKPDGRAWIQYSRAPFAKDHQPTAAGLVRPGTWTPPHLRWNAMRGEFVSISASRQDRPFLPPREYCPLCPTTPLADGTQLDTEVPHGVGNYEWAVFENMFPGLSLSGETPTGKCEVVLYSPRHDSTLAREPLSQIEGLVHVWQDRCKEISRDPNIEFVFPFENKGTEVGVTLHHPHGQIYAFNHLPPFIKNEHLAAQAHFEKNKQCLICSLTENELKDKNRIVFEGQEIVAFIPFAARYPYEVHITTRAHRPLLQQLTPSECRELSIALKTILMKYDALFGFPMPYIMAHHQAAARDENCSHYHWHIEIYPPYRTAQKLKYLAGVESGTGFFINDTYPEEKAAELRKIEVDIGSFDF
ncbi:MAG: galactose-1-phosphate uridylyltransferase [Betaproteobacteria bacterium]|nr:galactose-1-phosphate uridylyltransferase [Betaproteobacteria bacterium]